MSSRWVKIREYAARYEAEVDIARLEGAEIPVLLQGPETGIFGPGFAGATPLGVRLLVPREAEDAARKILDGAADGSDS